MESATLRAGMPDIEPFPFAGLQPEDRAILSVLKPPEVQSWLLAKIRHHEIYLRALSAAYNSASLVHRRLPPELLMEIFGHIHPKTCQGITLLHVCRHWRYIALKTPQFWSNMLRISAVVRKAESGDAAGLERLQTYLQRSSACRLPSLTLRGLKPHVVQVLTPHLSLLSSLTVHVGPNGILELFHLLNTGVPHLRDLSIHHAKNAEYLDAQNRTALSAIHCDQEKLPRLHSLRIPTIFLSPGIVLPSLQTLIMGGCSCQGCSGNARTHSLETILLLLCRCPSLLSLQFLEGSEHLPQTSDLVPLPTIPLPLLNKLSFERNTTQAISDVLSHLTLPSTVSVKFDCVREEGPCLPAPLHSIPPISVLESLEIVLNGTKFTARGHTAGSERLSFTTEDITGADLVGDLIHAFSPSSPSISRLYIGVKSVPYGDHLDVPRICRLLATFPHVTHLKVGRKCTDLFWSLAAASPQPPCPQLRHLVVKWALSWGDEFGTSRDLIEAALARRVSIGMHISTLEVTFTRLNGLNPDKVDVAQLKRILEARFGLFVGEVVVVLQPGPKVRT